MTRVKALISLCCLSPLAAVTPASAADLLGPPLAKSQAAGPILRQVDYERCVWDDGERVCHIYYDDDYDEGFDADWDHDYDPGYSYAAPGVVLGFGGVGIGHRHRGGYFVRH